MIKLYDYWLSGNCHKVRLMLSILKLEHELIPINIKELEQKSLDFLQLNPFGMVPVLIDGAEVLRDSQAILFYLGMKYGEDWLPRETVAMSKVVQWLSTSAQDIQNSLAAARVQAFLKAEARNDLAAASDRHAKALGRPFRKLTLRDTKSRWGSCSTQGDLMYSWRLVMAPPEVLDYVAAHEVAHLAEMNHSPAFWAVVERLFPNHAACRRWLRAHGQTLHQVSFGN